jgi:hypothetical protein
MEADALTEAAGEEAVRQLGVIYGGLIGVAVLMIQPFLTATTLGVSAMISVIAFAVAIPLLAALVMVNRQEVFRRRRTTSVTVAIAQGIAQPAAFVGLVAAFWHINWVTGVCFLTSGLVAVGVHSAGWRRVKSSREPASWTVIVATTPVRITDNCSVVTRVARGVRGCAPGSARRVSPTPSGFRHSPTTSLPTYSH